MVVFVLVWIHELVDVFAVPGVLVDWRRRDWLGVPGFPIVAEPCVEPWVWPLRIWPSLTGALVAAERGLESAEFDGVSGDGRVQASCFGFGLAAFRAERIRDRLRETVEARRPAYRFASRCWREGSERVYRYRYRFYAMFLLGCPLATC